MTIERSLRLDKYNRLRERLLTFASCQCDFVPAMQCAQAGFISQGQGDAVLCIWCRLVLREFKQPLDMLAIHQKHSSGCEFLRRLNMSKPFSNSSVIGNVE